MIVAHLFSARVSPNSIRFDFLIEHFSVYPDFPFLSIEFWGLISYGTGSV